MLYQQNFPRNFLPWSVTFEDTSFFFFSCYWFSLFFSDFCCLRFFLFCLCIGLLDVSDTAVERDSLLSTASPRPLFHILDIYISYPQYQLKRPSTTKRNQIFLLLPTKCGQLFLWRMRRAAPWSQEQLEPVGLLHQEDLHKVQGAWPLWWVDAAPSVGTSAEGQHQLDVPWAKPKRERLVALDWVHEDSWKMWIKTLEGWRTCSILSNVLICFLFLFFNKLFKLKHQSRFCQEPLKILFQQW